MKDTSLVCIFAFFVPLIGVANAQEVSKSDLPEDEAVERAETLILEVSKQRDMLPKRWAAMVDFRIESTPDAEQYLLVEGSSFHAEDKTLERKVRLRKQREYQNDSSGFGDFPSEQFDWQSKTEHLSIENDKIELVPPGVRRLHLDPFMLWLASSTCILEEIPANYAEFLFFAANRKCGGSWEDRRTRNIVSVWTTAKINAMHQKDVKLWTQVHVIHDKVLKMPIEFDITLFDSSKIMKSGKHQGQLCVRTSANWIKNEKYDIVLPTTILSNWMGNDESLEALFSVRWLFEGEVPDDTFTDPKTGKIVIPKFPPSDHDILKSEPDE